MRVLGIDPGLGITGYGVLDFEGEQVRVAEAGVIRTNEKAPLSERLVDLAREMESVITQFVPDVVAVEELYSHYGHPKTAIIMGHARGVIFMTAARSGVSVVPYAATRVKKALTGNGRATKSQMQMMICSALSLTTVPEPPDIADALAVALCHCRALQHSEVVGL
jgi:crossover junction endodeoxyribonuclease RuvC